MLTFYLVIAGILLFNGLLLALLSWAYHSPRFAAYRISTKQSMKVPAKKRLRVMVEIGALSVLLVAGFTYLLYPRLVYAGAAPPWRIALEAAGVLLLYDFAYHVLHRAMHTKRLMRLVHGVHHRARNPSAAESFFLHPLELLAGLSLMIGTTVLVGPIHVHAFYAVFFVYTTFNILVHSGLAFPSRLLWPINALARKHHIHHEVDFSKNLSSLTPLPDLIFRTAR